jgi:divalent metal cation (Fe/Co/Zn/Cd) transporter
MVHVEPIIPADTSTTQRVYHVARQRNLNVHDVRVRATRGREEVGLHLEVDPALTLGEAHAMADDLERAILAELPHVRRVTTHLEGVAEETLPHEDITASSPNLVALVERVAEVAVGEGRCHAVRVYRHGQGDEASYDLVLHCTLPAALPLEEAHARSEDVERALRAALPALNAVTVHAEPPAQERLAHGNR